MNSEQEKSKLLHLHCIALKAHIEKDARAFLAVYASQWYDVRTTGIRLRTKEEALPAIEQYFRRTHVHDISEITSPIIHISTDASMAWVIGEIRVRASQEVAEGKEQDFSFRCAWVSIYEKQEGEWAQVVDASSFQFQRNAEGSISSRPNLPSVEEVGQRQEHQ
jgi:ketosteroid isomerase-like protein